MGQRMLSKNTLGRKRMLEAKHKGNPAIRESLTLEHNTDDIRAVQKLNGGLSL